MVAISSPNSTLLLKKLCEQYPTFSFTAGDEFRWSPTEVTIYFEQPALQAPEGTWELFHELAHATLDHQAYSYDIELLHLEAAAWTTGRDLAQEFGIIIDEDYAQTAIDTYRAWLAARSECPNCQTIGIQKNKRTYQCFNCRCVWRVNDAKFCALRRFTTH